MDSQEILTALKERINDQIFQLKADKIVFYAKIDVDRHVSKKNNYRVFRAGRGQGKAFMGKPQRLRSAEDHLLLELRNAKNRARIFEPIRHDVWMLCIFGFENFYIKKNATRNKKINDLSNLIELPADCLQMAGVIENDSQICSLDLCRRIASDHNFIEIFLIEYDSQHV